MRKTRIALLGLGGVGGYYGGKLAQYYADSPKVEIIFIARGEHLQKIKEKGIRVITDGDDFTAKPALATDSPNEVGEVDYLILATKSYDLASSVDYIKPCIGEHTVVLPLLNGGDIRMQLQELLPETSIWCGCSYIVSRRIEPGVIRSNGNFFKMVYGSDTENNERPKKLEAYLKAADIDARLTEDIRDAIWQKFYFISVTASLTSYFDVGFNELLATEERRELTRAMSIEFLEVAKAEGIDTSRNTDDQVLSRVGILPSGSTTSMHSDFQSGGATEVETLTGAVIRFAEKHGVEVPNYKKVYEALKAR